MFLQALSTLVFNPPLQLYARHNMAREGAALFVEDIITYNICQPNLDPFFPYQDDPVFYFFFINATDNSSYGEVHLLFEKNIASVSGTTLYGGMLDSCPLVQSQLSPGTTALQEFQSISQTRQDKQDMTSPIASDPLHLCFCSSSKPDCSKLTTDTVYVRRGQPFSIAVVALGQANGSVPTIVRAQVPSRDSFLGNTEDIQTSDLMCSELQYSVFSTQDSVEVIVYADGPCRDIGESRRFIRVNLLPCPIGFQESLATCICDPVIQPFTNTCNVVDGTIERRATAQFWIGVVVSDNASDTGLIVHPHCPLNYCQDEEIHINLNDSDHQCAFNRTGVLCGGCQNGLSLTLGTSLCMSCTNVYLSLLLPLALAGVVLVAFLLLLQLTVAVGTINGLIFYANVIAVNSATFFPRSDAGFSVSKLFISWLNLDLGIATCFYDGMDTLAKVSLQFLFPAYVWLLIGGVIISSHYSSRASQLFGRNPVAVLSTLVLLSYTKVLRNIIAILSFTIIEYPDGQSEAVWLYDGNVWFLMGRHIPLFLVALFMLLVLFIPYTLYLTFGQCILAKSKARPCSWLSSKRLRPFLDAYHSPFVTRHRYWLGLLLLVRCALFLVTAFNVSGSPSVNLLAIVTSLLGILALHWINGVIYCHRALDTLELFFILNLGVLSVGTYHILVAGGDQGLLVNMSVGAAFAAFVGITIYHIYKTVKEMQVTRHLMQRRSHIIDLVVRLRNSGRNVLPSDFFDARNRNIVTTSVIPCPSELRESLLAS